MLTVLAFFRGSQPLALGPGPAGERCESCHRFTAALCLRYVPATEMFRVDILQLRDRSRKEQSPFLYVFLVGLGFGGR